MEAGQTFRCETFKLDMPIDRQQGFCAIQFRKGRETCIDCERGKTAAKETVDDVRASLPDIDHKKNRSAASERAQEILKSGGGKMAGKKLCSEGCGKGAVKDDLCTKHYRKKHGVAPFAKGSAKKQVGAKTSTGKRKKGHADLAAGECEGCKVLNLQLQDLNRAEAIMVAAGLCTAEKFEQARKIVRELSGE